jgi:hypothetical protein
LHRIGEGNHKEKKMKMKMKMKTQNQNTKNSHEKEEEKNLFIATAHLDLHGHTPSIDANMQSRLGTPHPTHTSEPFPFPP